LAKYSNPLNPQMIEVAAPVFELRQKIIDGIAGEIAHQSSLYVKQREELAGLQNQRSALASKKPKFYYFSGIYPRLWPHDDEPTGEKTYTIVWRIGKKSLNSPGAVAARKGGYRFGKYIKHTGRLGTYKKKDFKVFLQYYDAWELKLAYLYELERIRPLRTKLREFNTFLQTVKRAPDVPEIPHDFVDLQQ